MTKITDFFTALMRKYLPDPFVFAITLTLVTLVLALTVQGTGFITLTAAWGDGFWSLLAFTTQMAVILAMGYVLAKAPVVDHFLDWVCTKTKTPRQAVVVATVIGGIGSYLNWGFGLVIGGIVAKKLAYRIRGVHYPMIIAAAYTGFTLYGLGFSATIPLTISTPGHALEAQMGVVALSKTIFHPVMLATAAFVLITLPILNYFLHPKPGAPVTEIDRELFRAEMEAGGGVAGWKARRAIKADRKALAEGAEKVPFATRANDSRILSAVIGVFGLVYVVQHVVRGGIIDLNFINFFILFLGILLLATPSNYLAKLTEGIGTIAGILLQFPFYAGIMALMTASGLVETIANFFVSFSTEETLPFWGLVSSFVINFFAPSGGGHWVLQGPFMIDAAQQLGADIPAASVSVQLGNAWNDLVQPFWILPALAISRLKLKDIMGYTVIAMFYIGIVYTAATLLWGFLG